MIKKEKKMKVNTMSKKIFPIFCVVLGIIALVVGIHQRSTKDLYDSTVKATVVDVEENWETDADDVQKLVKTPYISYEVNGVKYESVVSPVQDDDLEVGDTVEILYQSQNPEKISAPNIGTSSIIFIVVGAVVTLGGLFGTVITFLRRR